jgi:competence ComEA-like helix-hairpin-helix protein
MRFQRSCGSALIVVLWAMVLLGAGVLSVLHATRLELEVARNFGDKMQARYLALAGLARAEAAIHAATQDLAREEGPAALLALRDRADLFQEIPCGRGRFSVYRAARPEEGSVPRIHGLLDEESRLNVNVVLPAELQQLRGMTAEAAAAIVDWRDPDGNESPLGAEADYYARLHPPLRIRNGPIETVRELLLVKGVSAVELLGEDRNGNGLLDPEEDDGQASLPVDNANGFLEAGWSDYLTLDSWVANVNRQGKPRVHAGSAEAQALAEVNGLTMDLAQAIVESRKVRTVSSLVDLLEVRHVEKVEQPAANAAGNSPDRPAAPGSGSSSPPSAPPPPSSPSTTPPAGNRAAPNRPGSSGPGGATPSSGTGRNTPGSGSYREVGDPLISRDLLIQIADGLTVRGSELNGVVNINTADATVLACLPGLDEEVAAAVVAYRQRRGYFASIAELLNVEGITAETFKKLNPRVAVHSNTWRVISEGEVPSSGARSRIQAVIRLDRNEVVVLRFREEF